MTRASATATITRADFFAALFPDPDGLLELRALPSKTRDFFTPCDSEGIERFIRVNAGDNLYFGVATRRTRDSGKLENCGLLSGLFIDIDFKVTPGPEARTLLERFPLKPSIVVNSGGGLHVYYLLREPLDLQTEAVNTRSLLRRLALTLGGDLSSAEPAHILRIPGTFNHKYTPARRVLIEAFDLDRQYNPGDFDDVLPAELGPVNGNGHGFTVGDKIKDGERNTTLYKLARSMKRSMKAKGLSDAAILAALRAENQAKCEPPLSDAEIEKIAGNAFKQPDRPEFAATGSNGDPLDPLRALADSPTAADIEAALRIVVNSLAGVDGLRRATLRQETLAVLKAKEVIGPAKLVDAAWALAGGSTDEGRAQPLTLADPDPWPEPVDGAALLNEIEGVITRYVVLPLEAAVSVALWVLFAHAHEAFDVSPILAITSPTKRCGKSLLEQIVGALLPRALTTSNISPAALFRAIEAYRPSLLIDEGDAFLTFSEELRGIINSGHTRHGAVVIRCDGDPIVARLFSTWTPKVLALIGALPGTVADRSVEIRMQRKGKGEVVERFRAAKLRELEPLCRQAARWAADNLAHLKTIDSAVPDSLNDRAADNWRSLLAIADLAGGEWLKRARQAALALSGESDAEGEGHGVTLIGDIVTIFDERDAARLSSTELIEELVKLELRPWNAWTRGKPITPRGLARLLKPFEIKPKLERLEGKEILRGYMVEDFFSVFSRYYGNLSVTSVTSEQNQGVSPDFYVLQNPSCNGYENDVTTEKQRDVTDVTDRIPESGGERETSAQRELFEEDDPGLLAARLADAEEVNPEWAEVTG